MVSDEHDAVEGSGLGCLLGEDGQHQIARKILQDARIVVCVVKLWEAMVTCGESVEDCVMCQCWESGRRHNGTCVVLGWGSAEILIN